MVTAAAAARCQSPCGWSIESGSHQGQSVAPSRPMPPPTASNTTAAQVPGDRSVRSTEITAKMLRATATGSAAAGKSPKNTPIVSKPGIRDHLSRPDRSAATTNSSQARVTSWAHSLPLDIGPWKRNDPIPVAIRAIPTQRRSGRRVITTIPATTSASVVSELIGCRRSPTPIDSQSAAAPIRAR